MVDVLIIGAGCAGLTAAIYATRAGHRVVVLEKLFHGGQISVTNEVENYPAIDRISGPDLANRIYEQAAALGADVRYEDVSEVDLAGPVKRVTTSGGEYEARAVIIANGKKDNILPMLLAVDSDTVCTRFIPASKPVSSVKKWIAHSEGFAKGEIHINKGAEEALTAPKATSVLLVGVTRIEGDFEKDDIVKIMNEEGVQIGVGCTAYDSEEARKQIGQRDLKPLIHYDYLYLD